MSDLPDKLRKFIDESTWIFAKIYAAIWPHEYIVREKVDETLFVELSKHIRSHGYAGKFYKMDLIYFDHANKVYWTMGDMVSETTIINRCETTQSYASRLARNDLPPPRNKT